MSRNLSIYKAIVSNIHRLFAYPASLSRLNRDAALISIGLLLGYSVDRHCFITFHQEGARLMETKEQRPEQADLASHAHGLARKTRGPLGTLTLVAFLGYAFVYYTVFFYALLVAK